MNNITFHEGDCLTVLRDSVDDETVDAVITDPPYGISFQSNRGKTGPLHKKIANDNLPYIWFLPEAYRVLKEGGSLVCFCRWDTQEKFRMAIECAGFVVKNQIIWDRVWHGMGDLKGNFAPAHDVAWFATKGKFTLAGKRPKTVLSYQRPSSSESSHPTQKPVALMEHLIESLVPVNGVVLDPFAGSGSTLQAARKVGRNSIGIEIDPNFSKIIRESISGHEYEGLLS